jgi:hypothetical protein
MILGSTFCSTFVDQKKLLELDIFTSPHLSHLHIDYGALHDESYIKSLEAKEQFRQGRF